MSRLVRLVQLINRYGPAIEFDLHDRFGLDLLSFFRHELSWRKLDVLVQGLPSGSAFWAARADDDELAAAVLGDKNYSPGGGAPALTEMSYTNQLLTDAVDLLAHVVDRVERLRVKKSGRVKPAPRPETAMSRVTRAKEDSYIDNLRAEVQSAQARMID